MLPFLEAPDAPLPSGTPTSCPQTTAQVVTTEESVRGANAGLQGRGWLSVPSAGPLSLSETVRAACFPLSLCED